MKAPLSRVGFFVVVVEESDLSVGVGGDDVGTVRRIGDVGHAAG